MDKRLYHRLIRKFFLYLVFYLLLVTIAVYAVEQLHATESQAGLVTGIFIVGTLIGRLFIGRMITTIGNKKCFISVFSFSYWHLLSILLTLESPFYYLFGFCTA